MKRFPQGAVLDKIQCAQDLLSYIQTVVDASNQEGLFILTGSQQFELIEGISQSLAGRTALLRLLPSDMDEAYDFKKKKPSIDQVLYKGFYPRIFDKNLNPTEAMSFYTNTYVERDLRQMINIKDLSKFEFFLKICAGRTGQIVNMSNIGNDCGINHVTVKNWLSVLEASYIIKLVRPYYKNFNKRLIKAPKLYFLDTGLAAFLLDVQNSRQMATHPLKGALFESLVVSELLKQRFNTGKTDNLFYFRDNVGNEIDIICDHGIELDAMEIKSGQTVVSDFFKGIRYLSNITNAIRKSYIVYGGAMSFVQNDVEVLSWMDMPKIT